MHKESPRGCMRSLQTFFDACHRPLQALRVVWPLTWITTTSQPIAETRTWEISRRCLKILGRYWYLMSFFYRMGKNHMLLLHKEINRCSKEEGACWKPLIWRCFSSPENPLLNAQKVFASQVFSNPVSVELQLLWKGCDWSQVMAQVWRYVLEQAWAYSDWTARERHQQRWAAGGGRRKSMERATKYSC